MPISAARPHAKFEAILPPGWLGFRPSHPKSEGFGVYLVSISNATQKDFRDLDRL